MTSERTSLLKKCVAVIGALTILGAPALGAGVGWQVAASTLAVGSQAAIPVAPLAIGIIGTAVASGLLGIGLTSKSDNRSDCVGSYC